MCGSAQRQGIANEWGKAIIMPLNKGKGSKKECSNYRRMNLLSVPGILYARVLTERFIEVIEGKVNEEQGGFRKGKG